MCSATHAWQWKVYRHKLAAAGEAQNDLATKLAAHAQQLSEANFSAYTEHQESTPGSGKDRCSAEDESLLR